jgi:hypothetical protein
MKKAIFLVAALHTAGSVGAQSSGGYYEFIPYYNNDPFVFCTVGVPWDCWAPISPQLGLFTVTNPYCFNPTSAAQFARVCPRAFLQGSSSAQRTSAVSTTPARDPADAGP